MQRKPKALIFIGFRSKRKSILSAREEGYKTILLTRKILPGAKKLFNLIIEDNILDEEVIKKIIPLIKKKYRVKGIISNYEHYVVARSYLAWYFSIPSTTVYGACCSRNKAMQRHALKYMKENIDFRTIKTEQEAIKAFNKLGKDVFLKAIAGIKSRFIFHITSLPDLKKAFQTIKKNISDIDEDLYNDYNYCDFNFKYPNPKSTFLIEKAETGSQITTLALASKHTIWHAPSACDVYTAKDIGIDDSYLAFRILPSNKPKEAIKAAKKTTETAIRILGLQYCPAHSEMIYTKDKQIKMIEIASRMGGYRPRMYKEAYGLNVNKLLVSSIIGKEIKTRKRPIKYVSLNEIFPKKEGLFQSIHNLQELQQDKNIKDIKVQVQEDEMVGPAKINYAPVLQFLVFGSTYNQVYEKSLYYQKNLTINLK